MPPNWLKESFHHHSFSKLRVRATEVATGWINQQDFTLIIIQTPPTAAPLHWIYDQDKVKTLTQEANTVEFYPKPECPFYTIPVGSNSAYGDQVYVTLKNVAENKGKNCLYYT